MSISTVLHGVSARSAPPKAERASSKGFLLGMAISAGIWALLGALTIMSTTSSIVPELPSVLLSN